MTIASSSSMFSVRLDPEDEARLERLTARWATTGSDAIRRLLRALESDAALSRIEEATWPKELPHTCATGSR